MPKNKFIFLIMVVLTTLLIYGCEQKIGPGSTPKGYSKNFQTIDELFAYMDSDNTFNDGFIFLDETKISESLSLKRFTDIKLSYTIYPNTKISDTTVYASYFITDEKIGIMDEKDYSIEFNIYTYPVVAKITDITTERIAPDEKTKWKSSIEFYANNQKIARIDYYTTLEIEENYFEKLFTEHYLYIKTIKQ